MLLVAGLILFVVSGLGIKRSKDAIIIAKKEVNAWYEQAFLTLNKIFLEKHQLIYKDDKAQHIVFFHSSLFLDDMKKKEPDEVYAIHQAGIYEDIRFLCSLVSFKSDFLNLVPPLPSKITKNKHILRACKAGVIVGILSIVLFWL